MMSHLKVRREDATDIFKSFLRKCPVEAANWVAALYTTKTPLHKAAMHCLQQYVQFCGAKIPEARRNPEPRQKKRRTSSYIPSRAGVEWGHLAENWDLYLGEADTPVELDCAMVDEQRLASLWALYGCCDVFKTLSNGVFRMFSEALIQPLQPEGLVQLVRSLFDKAAVTEDFREFGWTMDRLGSLLSNTSSGDGVVLAVFACLFIYSQTEPISNDKPHAVDLKGFVKKCALPEEVTNTCRELTIAYPRILGSLSQEQRETVLGQLLDKFWGAVASLTRRQPRKLVAEKIISRKNEGCLEDGTLWLQRLHELWLFIDKNLAKAGGQWRFRQVPESIVARRNELVSLAHIALGDQGSELPGRVITALAKFLFAAAVCGLQHRDGDVSAVSLSDQDIVERQDIVVKCLRKIFSPSASSVKVAKRLEDIATAVVDVALHSQGSGRESSMAVWRELAPYVPQEVLDQMLQDVAPPNMQVPDEQESEEELQAGEDQESDDDNDSSVDDEDGSHGQQDDEDDDEDDEEEDNQDEADTQTGIAKAAEGTVKPRPKAEAQRKVKASEDGDASDSDGSHDSADDIVLDSQTGLQILQDTSDNPLNSMVSIVEDRMGQKNQAKRAQQMKNELKLRTVNCIAELLSSETCRQRQFFVLGKLALYCVHWGKLAISEPKTSVARNLHPATIQINSKLSKVVTTCAKDLSKPGNLAKSVELRPDLDEVGDLAQEILVALSRLKVAPESGEAATVAFVFLCKLSNQASSVPKKTPELFARVVGHALHKWSTSRSCKLSLSVIRSFASRVPAWFRDLPWFELVQSGSSLYMKTRVLNVFVQLLKMPAFLLSRSAGVDDAAGEPDFEGAGKLLHGAMVHSAEMLEALFQKQMKDSAGAAPTTLQESHKNDGAAPKKRKKPAAPGLLWLTNIRLLLTLSKRNAVTEIACKRAVDEGGLVAKLESVKAATKRRGNIQRVADLIDAVQQLGQPPKTGTPRRKKDRKKRDRVQAASAPGPAAPARIAAGDGPEQKSKRQLKKEVALKKQTAKKARRKAKRGQ
mmetsp:Transcript_33360/g.86601  ORF Transcript_33360/g.86601 Transcript_33360/m.86601 type:complete len:1041 (-) Transcript_33360:291-3413(-)